MAKKENVEVVENVVEAVAFNTITGKEEKVKIPDGRVFNTLTNSCSVLPVESVMVLDPIAGEEKEVAVGLAKTFNTLNGKMKVVLLARDVLMEIKREFWREAKRVERLCRCKVDGHRCTKSDEECQRCHWYLADKQNGGEDSVEYMEEEKGVELDSKSDEFEISLYAMLLDELFYDVEDDLKLIAKFLGDGYTEKEISDVLGRSRNTVHSQIVKIRKLMQQRYER